MPGFLCALRDDLKYFRVGLVFRTNLPGPSVRWNGEIQDFEFRTPDSENDRIRLQAFLNIENETKNIVSKKITRIIANSFTIVYFDSQQKPQTNRQEFLSYSPQNLERNRND